jgi:hypothetical protein
MITDHKKLLIQFDRDRVSAERSTSARDLTHVSSRQSAVKPLRSRKLMSRRDP